MIAMKLADKGYMKDKEIIETLGISKSAFYVWKKKNKEWGVKALKKSKTVWGKKKDMNKNLTKKEKNLLVKIISKEPRETEKLMLDFGLWTVKLIQHVIKEVFGKDLKRNKTREIVIELWYTNQTPLFRAYQQNPEKVEKRLDEELPSILNEAKEEWRSVFYGDEAGFKSTDNRGKTRWKKWVTPIVKATGARFGVNAISIVSTKWVLRFMVYKWNFNTDLLISFLKKVIYKRDEKITLILDWHPTHKTKKLKYFLESIDHQIKIYHLPWYSPELNPDEQVWLHARNDLKWLIPQSISHQIAMVRKVLHKQQKQKDKLQSYFKHPDVQRKST